MKSDLELYQAASNVLKDITNIMRTLSTDSGGNFTDKQIAVAFAKVDTELKEIDSIIKTLLKNENSTQDAFEARVMGKE